MPSDGVTIDRETYEMLRAFLNAEKSDVERMGAVRDEFCRRLAADELKDVSAESGADSFREQLSSGAKLFASAQYFISMIAISRIANGDLTPTEQQLLCDWQARYRELKGEPEVTSGDTFRQT